MTMKDMFKKVMEVLTFLPRKAADAVDRHPGGSSIRHFAEAVKVVDFEGKFQMVVPTADKVTAEVELAGAEDMGSKERIAFCKGANAMLKFVSNVRRSAIKPVLSLHHEAVVAQRRAEAGKLREQRKAEKDQRKKEVAETLSSGILQTPPAATDFGSGISAAPAPA